FSFSAALAQQLDYFRIALLERFGKRRIPVHVLLIDVASVSQQQFYHLLIAANDSLMQEGDVLVIFYVGIRACVQNCFGRRYMAVNHRQAQRRPPILLDLEIHVRFVRQQQFYRVALIKCRCPVQRREPDLIQIAQFSGLMDFRAVDSAAPTNDSRGQNRAGSTEAEGNSTFRGYAVERASLFRLLHSSASQCLLAKVVKSSAFIGEASSYF